MSETDPAQSTPPAFGRPAAVVVALMMSSLVLAGLMAYHLLRRPWPPAPPEVARDPLLSQGRAIFLMRCSTCHGFEGRGDGPLSTTIAKPPVANLTDADWKHGDRPEKVLAVIENGVPNTRMDSWRHILGPPETRAVAAYVYYLARRPVPEELRKPG
ncbi:MAG: c-type cytochrome [Isosphaeraceae bacterium]